jgi:hypothetical protein
MATVTAKAHKYIGKGFSNDNQWTKLTYDFAEDAGAFADVVKLATVQGKIMVTRAIVQVETACASLGSATVAVGAASADADGFLTAAHGPVASLVDDFTYTESTSVGLVVGDADTITLDIGTADLTAGKINVFVWWVNVD